MKTHRYFRFAASVAALALAAACNNGTTSPSTSTAPALFSRQAKSDGGGSLAPGVYCFDAAGTLPGVLTRAGPSNASWTFKIGPLGTGALTGTNFSVVMAGGAQACNVSWWVSQAATLTDSDLKGSILAGAAITLTRGTFNGNAWSKADVTVTGTAVTGCASSGGGNGDGDDDDKGHKHKDKDKDKCNQGVGNGAEGCDPGNSNHRHGSNDENGGTPRNPGRRDH